MSVVEKARSSEEETSGATSGGSVAEYLRSTENKSSQIQDKILERLINRPESVKLQEEVVEKEETDKVDEKLKEILGKTFTSSQSLSVEEPSKGLKSKEEKEKNLRKANEKLVDLLGGKEQK